MSIDEFNLPAPKRQRTDNREVSNTGPEGSRLFTPFRVQ